jgi:2-hydroxy-3-keto-5-methylthiopentenyl-1-phosphate phosphatase
MGLRLFVDFDGTITRTDVGNALFARFGGTAATEAVKEYREGRRSAQECFRAEAQAMDGSSPDEVYDFIDGQEIDPEFVKFAAWCRSTALPLTVVSDGLDLYVGRILGNAGLDGMLRYSNRASLTTSHDRIGARLELEFPFADAVCTRCACCKRNIMLTHAGEDDIICYIGDGFSDFCPVQYADVVFAKGELQSFCQTMNISYYPYSTFADVQRRLEGLRGRRRLSHRRAAAAMRQRAFREES